MSDGEIIVHVADDDDDAAGSSRRIAAIDARAAASRSETARLRQETARLRAESARSRVDTALSTTLTEIAEAQSIYASAFEAGDFAAAGEATARIASGESRKMLLEGQRQAIARMPISSGDPVEDYCANRTEPTARWLREHPDWVTDPRKNAKLTGAHHLAVGDGLEPDSAEYFSYVEKTIGLRGGGSNSRNSRTHVVDGGKQVFLTKGERERATDGSLTFSYGPRKGEPLGVQEYARRKAAMIKSGGWYDKL